MSHRERVSGSRASGAPPVISQRAGRGRLAAAALCAGLCFGAGQAWGQRDSDIEYGPDGVKDCATPSGCPVYREVSTSDDEDVGSNSDGRLINLYALLTQDDDGDGNPDHEYVQFEGFLTDGETRDTWRFLVPKEAHPNANNAPLSFILYYLEPTGVFGATGDADTATGVSILFRAQNEVSSEAGSTAYLGEGSDAATSGGTNNDCLNCFSRFAGIGPFGEPGEADRPAVIIDRLTEGPLRPLSDATDREWRIHIDDDSGTGNPYGSAVAPGEPIQYAFRVSSTQPNFQTQDFTPSIPPIPLPPALWALGGALGLFAAAGAIRRRRPTAAAT